jgi:hypothetical protein
MEYSRARKPSDAEGSPISHPGKGVFSKRTEQGTLNSNIKQSGLIMKNVIALTSAAAHTIIYNRRKQ